MAGARGPAAIVRALEWGTAEAASTVQALAAADLELIVAADVCYVDQVPMDSGITHIIVPLQDGVSPSTAAFVATCAALCKPNTQVPGAQAGCFSLISLPPGAGVSGAAIRDGSAGTGSGSVSTFFNGLCALLLVLRVFVIDTGDQAPGRGPASGSASRVLGAV